MQLLLPFAAALVLDAGSRDSLRGGAAKAPSCEDKATTLLFATSEPAVPVYTRQHPEGRKTLVSRAPERALDYCALKPEAEKKYFCSYFEEFVKDAFAHQKKDTLVTPPEFCSVVEAHANGVEAQAKMFGVLAHYYGLNQTQAEKPFHDHCIADVTKAISPDPAVAHDKAADTLYLYCMNYQSCDHHTMVGAGKDCEDSLHPATGKHLCELLRSDVVELTVKHPMEAYSPEDLCEWMFRFTHRQAKQIEAYRYVYLGEDTSPSLIPPVSKDEAALLLGSLQNGAKKHWIRDHTAHFAPRASAAAALALGLAL